MWQVAQAGSTEGSTGEGQRQMQEGIGAVEGKERRRPDALAMLPASRRSRGASACHSGAKTHDSEATHALGQNIRSGHESDDHVNGSVAVFNINVCSVSQSGIELKLIPSVSNKTFYDLFTDREDCFLTAFDHAIDVLAARVRPVFEGEREWSARVRAGLGALLIGLDEEPALRRLLFVEALVAGERVLERRAQVLDALAGVVDEGRGGMSSPGEMSPLTAEGLVGASFGVIHARLSQRRPEPLIELLGALMATIVLPYRGSAAAARELKPAAPSARRGASRSRTQQAKCATHTSARGRRDAQPIAALRPLGSALPADFRLTVRTQSALVAVAQLNAGGADPNNREVSERMGVADQGQVSRLMMRLAEQGLVENTRGHTKGLEKAWRLTAHGEAMSSFDPVSPSRALNVRFAKHFAPLSSASLSSSAPRILCLRAKTSRQNLL